MLLMKTLLQLFTCSLAAFAFTKLHFPGRDKIFVASLATMMVPWHAIMIPQFIVVKAFGLYNTHPVSYTHLGVSSLERS